jgi:hypothetical protein
MLMKKMDFEDEMCDWKCLMASFDISVLEPLDSAVTVCDKSAYLSLLTSHHHLSILFDIIHVVVENVPFDRSGASQIFMAIVQILSEIIA